MIVRNPPSAITGPLGEYLREIAQALNAIPNISSFSGLTPESVVTGRAGDILVAPFGSSTSSTLFVKIGPVGTASTVSWARVSLQTLS